MREQCWDGIYLEGANERFENYIKSLYLFTPGGACQCLEDVDAGNYPLRYNSYVESDGEVEIESDTEDIGVAL